MEIGVWKLVNTLRGFGAAEVDITLRRQFHLRERLSLQARADFLNLFNHPNFGPPTNYKTSPLFGQATQMLGCFARRRRPDRRPQPALPDRLPALGATGAEADVRSAAECPADPGRVSMR